MTKRPTERTMRDTLLATAALLEVEVVTTKLLPRLMRLMAEGLPLDEIVTTAELERATPGREPSDTDILYLLGSWLNAFERFGRYKLGETIDASGQAVEERIWAFGLALERIATYIQSTQADIAPQLALQYAGLTPAEGE